MREKAATTDKSKLPMSVEEARSVLWLRSNPRPLGELLDEGYLDRERLQWAARWAYNPKLKAAAAVLLEHLEHAQPPPPASPAPAPTVAAGLTIEQARATPWPFGPLKGQPMGALVDAKRLLLKDLVYAIENAWDDRVRRAAIVLAALSLEQAVKEPPPPAGPLKVVSGGRSFAERKQLQLMMAEGLILGVSFGAVMTWGILTFLRSRSARPSRPLTEVLSTPEGLIALLIALALMAAISWLFNFLIRIAVNWLEKEIERYRKGQEGEEQAVEAMRQVLDGNWTLFRNVALPGRRPSDIDAVLIGPPGVWALEVKSLSGKYRNVGEHWEVRAGRRWKPLRRSPSRQAQDNAARLSRFLRVGGIHQWVTPAVVWADAESTVTVENPAVAVWTLDRLPEELGNLWQERTIDDGTRTRILEKLTALCQPKKGTAVE